MKCAKTSLLLACGVLLALPVCVKAQLESSTPAAATPGDSLTVDQILDREIRASGGKDAWMHVTSMHMKGTLEISGNAVTAIFESYEIAPNKSLQTIMVGQSIAMRHGFDGVNGWKYDPGRGAEDLVGAELEDARIDADFYELIQLKELFPRMVLQGEASVDGRNVYAIIGTPARGTPRTLYFDKTSGLLIGVSQTIASGGKTSQADSFFDDFRMVNGIQVPYTIRIKADGVSLVIHLQSVQTNLIILNSGFSKPVAPSRAPAPVAASPSPKS
jgi:hypothetical protein